MKVLVGGGGEDGVKGGMRWEGWVVGVEGIWGSQEAVSEGARGEGVGWWGRSGG